MEFKISNLVKELINNYFNINFDEFKIKDIDFHIKRDMEKCRSLAWTIVIFWKW